MHFVIFHPYDTPTFKTKALRLVSNEGQVKRLLQLYKSAEFCCKNIDALNICVEKIFTPSKYFVYSLLH